MALKKNYDGMRIHNFVVIKRLPIKDDGHYDFLCKCDCGKEFIMKDRCLHKTQTCGCGRYASRTNRAPRYKHHGRQERLYGVWHGMKCRCTNPKNASYKDYGARGIKICDEWLNDYAAFRKWAYENGYKPNAKMSECTLDRIDVDGNYEPSNCRWVDCKVQANNRRVNHLATLNGETHNITEWASILGINAKTLSQRFLNGWSDEKALTTPVKQKKSRNRKGGE